ncbi:MAG: hypothetical protein J2P52_08475 [Blastocatellia bacterium]|nr:hypothetical protein [Blastocatellia bacterium]
MIITSQIMIEPGLSELKETWDLDGDRKTLIITKELLSNKSKMVFKRQ